MSLVVYKAEKQRKGKNPNSKAHDTIVERNACHNVSMICHTPPGSGCTQRVFLPVATAPAASPQPPRSVTVFLPPATGVVYVRRKDGRSPRRVAGRRVLSDCIRAPKCLSFWRRHCARARSQFSAFNFGQRSIIVSSIALQ
jgi:hypothetical protein